MAAALGLARRGLGVVWPNPAVGCILVREGRVVGRGWTQPGGRPHAESEALGRAGAAARGATAYVTLEPCAHQGKTPPCTEALIAAGLSRAVVALEDPDPRVKGAGLRALEAAGVALSVGLGAAEAGELNAGFIMRINQRRPLVTLKTATTLDGRIATRSGASQWITGAPARRQAHGLRARHDAILVGSGTLAADDPELTCRLPGLAARSPLRLVLDSHLATPLTAKLVATALTLPTWIITLRPAEAKRRLAFTSAGVEIIEVAADAAGKPDLSDALAVLAERGVTRLLVEGGSQLAAGFLRAGLVDRLVWFRSPAVIGGDGLPAAAAFGVEELGQSPRFRRLGSARCGDDTMETFAIES
ncbi:MAG TPA: bifunctional diaminohydroxyphosphoribosylaminopyrimidine deaminase/5-amino-6-(5-phosphoribosylamino)uracil reductase RibD [Alphaproteobacteria bacterium]|jgi:diaminohydroxyphosphoribosylaminopyrimidine deaminase/5-amino-6-(5-phosphoribosylamino)uracil reductase|nr:bifunctional diaminohydroxyphosphoribosylaminopyrimidine deaminase/5-amino-6-(5-phosphoribosylamino)uracil reductase RibD [Alphaproteobacteria bacterium]